MAKHTGSQTGDYVVVVQKVANPFTRNVHAAAQALSEQVSKRAAHGWEPQGGVAIGAAGTAPYLLQAMFKRK
jgi:hypothetical protein